MKPATTALERVAIGLVSLALSIGLIAVLSGFFANRDQAGVGGGGTTSGQRYPDQGDAHLRPGQLRPVYNSEPPTSGPHIPVAVDAEGTELTDDQLLEALELGDVVIAYGSPRPPAPLTHLVDEVSGSFTPALAAAGQAVILDHRPGTAGVIGLAWTRMLRASSPSDPSLAQFAGQWLGRGAPSQPARSG